MRFRGYQRPHKVGWLGWFEDDEGELIGFLALDGHFVFRNPAWGQ
jgi:hypothetical protein